MQLASLALGCAFVVSLGVGEARAGSLASRREALFGDEIPVISIVSDSIGIGAGMGRLGKARHTFVRKLFDAGFVVHLNGRGFTQAADLDDEYSAAVIADNFLWKAALVMAGTNDFSLDRPLDEVIDGYGRFLDRIMGSLLYGSEGQTLVCVTPLQRFDDSRVNAEGYTLQDLRDTVRWLCEMRGLPVWEGTALLPHDPLIGLNEPSRYFHDGVHPNRRGHKILARSLADALLSYFERRPEAGAERATHVGQNPAAAPSLRGSEAPQ